MNAIPDIPVRVDVYALFIFLGVIQGLLLAFFFFFKKGGTTFSNRLQGLLLLGMSFTSLEIFLCYTGNITRVIHLVDFSEPFNFVFGPAFYLFLRAKSSPGYQFNIRRSLHFLPFVLYSLYSVLFFMQTAEFKFNAYLSAYHPEMPHINRIRIINPDPLRIKSFVNELTFLHVFIYLALSLYMIYQVFKKEKLPLFSNSNRLLAWLRNFTLLILFYILATYLIQLSFVEDLGDHFTASFISIIIYAISISVITKSSYFSESQSKKYVKSSLTPEMKERIAQKVQELMEKEKPFMDNTFSLPKLAKIIKVSPHHLSHTLNECLQKSFFEYTAFYRIKEAEKFLNDPNCDHLTIEEIAEKVGYNSKSAFNTAFKKQTGKTPSQFREERD